MKIKWLNKLIGARTIKTGLATFLTALFCQLLTLPAIFAVITSIVSIEPTAKASLRKAYVRFPASILGAFIAVTSTYFLGESALSYSIAATVTIFVCYKLKLYDGLLVASLTAVAMVPNIHTDFAYNFFSRLATTTIGLGTAGVVNFFVLPPKYINQIKQLLDIFETKMMNTLNTRINEITNEKITSNTTEQLMVETDKLISKIEQLKGYQKEELQFHKNTEKQLELAQITHRLNVNRLIQLHINHLIMLPHDIQLHFTEEEQTAMNHLIQSFHQFGETRIYEPHKPSLSLLKMSVKHLDEFDENQFKNHMIYEILMINKLLEQHPNKRR